MRITDTDQWWFPERGNAWVIFRHADKVDRSNGHYVRWYASKQRALAGGEHPVRLNFHGERSRTLAVSVLAQCPTGDHAWVLFDTGNGHKGLYRYLWWFNTRREALAHRKSQNAVKGNARLSRPYRMVVV